MLVVAASLAFLAAAQEPVPAFEWHGDPAVSLPAGAMSLHGMACASLFDDLGLADAEPKHCYLVFEADGAREALILAFEAAGYTLEREVSPEEGAASLSFVHPTRTGAEGVTLLLSDGSMFILGYWTTN